MQLRNLLRKWTAKHQDLKPLLGFYMSVVLHWWCILFGAIMGIWCSSFAIRGISFIWKDIIK